MVIFYLPPHIGKQPPKLGWLCTVKLMFFSSSAKSSDTIDREALYFVIFFLSLASSICSMAFFSSKKAMFVLHSLRSNISDSFSVLHLDSSSWSFSIFSLYSLIFYPYIFYLLWLCLRKVLTLLTWALSCFISASKLDSMPVDLKLPVGLFWAEAVLSRFISVLLMILLLRFCSVFYFVTLGFEPLFGLSGSFCASSVLLSRRLPVPLLKVYAYALFT